MMANVLTINKQVMVISVLAEGSSIRSIEELPPIDSARRAVQVAIAASFRERK
jgi:hypothetical protein